MRKIILFLTVIVMLGCKDKLIAPTTVIHSIQIDNKQPFADGSTIINISVAIDPQADADKRSVIFSTSAGTFLPGTDTTITKTASFENGQLIARVKFKVPQVPRMLVIKVTPAAQNIHTSYQVLDTVNVLPSLPATVMLLPSSLGVKTGFTNEISLTATLKNALLNNVSIGTKVRFDQYSTNGTPVSGLFRVHRDTSDATSTATASYTAGNISAGTILYLKCTYIDPFGNPSLKVKDSVLINVTN